MRDIVNSLTIIFIMILYKELFKVNIKDIFKIISLILVVALVINRFIGSHWQSFILITLIEVGVLSYVLKKKLNISLERLMICKTIIFIVKGLFFANNQYNMDNRIDIIRFAIACVVSIVVMKIILKKEKINVDELVTEYSICGNVIINILFFLIIINLINVINIDYEIILIEIFMLIFLIVFSNMYYYKSFSKIKIEKEKIETSYRYNKVVNELIEHIKGNQHEYKNHLNTITSIIYLSTDIIEAKKEVNKYMEIISQEVDFNKVLSIDNMIIKAIIYSKILECEEKGIEFIFNIKGDIKKLNIESSDLTVILSNVLNNAIEAAEKSIQKKVQLEIDINERKHIIIKNTVDNIDISEIGSFLKRGFSKKGKNRGYGLYNVKKIVRKYYGEVNIVLEDEWVVVNIII
ncbi:sensor histidine kinase [Clostridium gasigenes]|uniref:sensor histidine kinase n=1 Tax=Clostridium gasigenes TaxID=94869 RepID=UPI0014386106|nr:ATP-binding protein [Clostridium gasigenes]NKF08021.1 sensor histidine kinase [Clostridium gasigenes]QSW20603.1 sensor histidine kinase [Clostridium gasigenes]